MNGRVVEQKVSHSCAIEAPTITLLGSLDDSQGGADLSLTTVSNKPIFAIIYSGL